MLLITVKTGEAPHIPDAECMMVEPLDHGLYRVTIRYGFMEQPIVPRTVARLTAPGLTFDPEQMPYFVNRTRVIPTDLPGMALWREHLYTLMRRNVVSAADFFGLPPTRVFEIGTSVEM
jgi:KUP system potassium uptake protein